MSIGMQNFEKILMVAWAVQQWNETQLWDHCLRQIHPWTFRIHCRKLKLQHLYPQLRSLFYDITVFCKVKILYEYRFQVLKFPI